ncbi:nucleotide pyrophosphohydrolase [Mycoplasma sp. P36-A1]|uniref:nucleotide pyrophosphohydrolase n=1 Tax=Mycoplasma sp. P36-A1 TaxID=3252900 RepID=UPI003C2BF6EA
MSDISNITETINKFRNDRNWRQFHNEKDLALSISLEAAELLEKFQWKNSEQAVLEDLEGIKDELADVLIYCIMFADNLDLDIETIIRNKVIKNNEKYPIELFKDSNKKYNK